jgi:hypothetical protein
MEALGQIVNYQHELLRDLYEFRVKLLSLRLNDVAVDEGLVPRDGLLELDKVLKEGKSENVLKYTSRNAEWCSRIDTKYHFTDSLFSLMRLVGAPNLDYVLHGSILPIELLLARISKPCGRCKHWSMVKSWKRRQKRLKRA